MAVMVLLAGLAGAGEWGRFGERADEPVPCGGKTPFDWWVQRHEALVQEARKGDAQIVFLGDSLTDFWSKEGKRVWEKEYVPLKAANFGIGGDQTQYVIYRLTHGVLEAIRPRVVVLEIGINNLAVSRHTPAETAIGIKGLVRLLRERLPGTKILLLALFPQGASADDVSRLRVAAVNQEIASLDDGTMVRYLDFGDRWLDADGNLLRDLRTDGAHLSEKGYQLWADTMRETLHQMLAPGAAAPLMP